MTYFETYSQDNCLLECRVKKISKRCKCVPWFVPRKNRKTREATEEEATDHFINDLDVCTEEGSKCFEEESKEYHEDFMDRAECDCKNDCEMVHTFSTLQVNLFLLECNI